MRSAQAAVGRLVLETLLTWAALFGLGWAIGAELVHAMAETLP